MVVLLKDPRARVHSVFWNEFYVREGDTGCGWIFYSFCLNVWVTFLRSLIDGFSKKRVYFCPKRSMFFGIIQIRSVRCIGIIIRVGFMLWNLWEKKKRLFKLSWATEPCTSFWFIAQHHLPFYRFENISNAISLLKTFQMVFFFFSLSKYFSKTYTKCQTCMKKKVKQLVVKSMNEQIINPRLLNNESLNFR